MFLSVQEMEIREIRFGETFAPGAIEYFEKGLRQTAPLVVEGRAALLPNTQGEIRVQGRLQVRMEAECDRCLEAVAFPLDTRFDLFYRPASQLARAEDAQLGEGETEMGFYQDRGLELVDVLREHILLSLPMQKVCSEDCRGICPVCGQNRNLVSCGCRQEYVDNRWSALRGS